MHSRILRTANRKLVLSLRVIRPTAQTTAVGIIPTFVRYSRDCLSNRLALSIPLHLYWVWVLCLLNDAFVFYRVQDSEAVLDARQRESTNALADRESMQVKSKLLQT